MDIYAEQMKEKVLLQRRNVRIALLLSFCSTLLLAVWWISSLGGYHIDMTLNGQQNVKIGLGKAYRDPGATAVFCGAFLPEEGIPLTVSCQNTPDTAIVGEQQITYRARFLFWKEEITRSCRVYDRTKPRIILIGDPQTYIIPGEEYEEEGYYAADNYDGDISHKVEIISYHNRILYRVSDSSGNVAEAERKLVYYDPVYPELTLNGPAEMELRIGQRYSEPGYTCTDNLDGDLTDQVVIIGHVDIYHAGMYNLTYSVTDSYGNKTVQVRKVKVASPADQLIIEPEGKVIYLTFDDGPGPYTRQLLDILKKYNVKATFFVVKSKYLDLLEDIAEEGHAIGIHSVTHNYRQIYASEEAYVEDMLEMQKIIEDRTGIHTTLVRFPGGSSNTVSKFNKGIMTRLTKLLGQMGFQYFDWNVNSGDAGETTKTERVVEYVMDGVQEYDAAIVLQHDIKAYSVEAVEAIILWGLENGYQFLPLDATSPNAHHQVRN